MPHMAQFSTLRTLKALLLPNGDRSGREDEKGMHYVCMACVNIQKANMPFVSYTHTHLDIQADCSEQLLVWYFFLAVCPQLTLL